MGMFRQLRVWLRLKTDPRKIPRHVKIGRMFAGGNPARIIRNRFDDDTIAALLEIQWWNWPMERLKS